MTNKKYNNVFLVLGSVWIIVGLIIYQDSGVWPLGFIFLILGIIGKYKFK